MQPKPYKRSVFLINGSFTKYNLRYQQEAGIAILNI